MLDYLRAGLAKSFAAVLLAAVVCTHLAAAAPAAGPAGRAFYTAPQFSAGVHGDVIWSRPADGAAALPSAARNVLVLYRTTAQDGSAVAVSGVVSIPKGTPPAGGWPAIAWTHGTTGDAIECAPSLDTASGAEHSYLYAAEAILDEYVAHGYAVVATDYEGNGTPGVHPYLVGDAEARDAIDNVRAARQLEPSIGARYLVMGHSQGGHSALFAAARSAAWAPELSLVGTVALAPASHILPWLTNLVREPNSDLGFVFAALLVRGYASVDPTVVPDRLWSQRMVRLSAQLEKRCAIDLLRDDAWASIVPYETFLRHADLAPLLRDAAANEPGSLDIAVPTLLVQGTNDEFVPAAATDALDAELCARSGTVDYQVVPAASHVGVLAASLEAVRAWVDARFTGVPAVSDCMAKKKAAG